MKNIFFSILFLTTLMFVCEKAEAQQQKIGIFNIDYMVQAMPGYREVDSLVQLYDRDSLNTEHDIYVSEYQRLDSTYKADSLLVAQGKKSKAILDYTAGERQKMAINLTYWQQIAQQKENSKREQLSQPLYVQVGSAYRRILETKKYTLIFKPEAFEFGTTAADNLFIAVAKELKLTSLPQELLQIGNDPDAAQTKTIPPKTAPVKKP